MEPEARRRVEELRPYAEQARQMEGWTFAYSSHPVGPPPPWDYVSRARELIAAAKSVLDLGTGGGEVYATLLAGYQGQAIAFEAWAPNVPVAHRRLAPLGVSTVHSFCLELALATASIDLVLNRHEELLPAEVARVLRPGGVVLTQQVHPDWHAELRDYFPRMTIWEQHHETYPAGFASAGLAVVDFREHNQAVAYRSLGELVYVLTAAPWTIPDFDVEADLPALLAVERDLTRPEGIILSDRRYILEAHKPPEEHP